VGQAAIDIEALLGELRREAAGTPGREGATPDHGADPGAGAPEAPLPSGTGPGGPGLEALGEELAQAARRVLGEAAHVRFDPARFRAFLPPEDPEYPGPRGQGRSGLGPRSPGPGGPASSDP